MGRQKGHAKFIRERKKHINKFAGLSRDWVGANNLFMCFSFGPFLMGEKKHINKIPPKIPGQARDNFVYVFFSLCVFFRSPPKPTSDETWGCCRLSRFPVKIWAQPCLRLPRFMRVVAGLCLQRAIGGAPLKTVTSLNKEAGLLIFHFS